MIDRATVARVHKELERTVRAMLLHDDSLFYAHVLLRMGRVVSGEVDTMAVGMREGRVVLFVNPSFWDSLATAPRHRQGVLAHELLHVVLRHLERSKSYPDQELFNIAADLAVNSIVGRDRLPASAWLAETAPPELGLVPGLSADEYYEVLKESWRSDHPGLRWSVGSNAPGRGSHAPWLASAGAAAGPGGDSGSGTESLVRIATNELVNAAVREVTAQHGTIPAGVARALQAAKPGRPRANWRTVLRIFGASGMATHLKPTIMSESKRFGTTPGVRIRQRQTLAVVVDTSGSIEAEVLDAFFSEIHALWRLGVEVTVIECDAEIPEGGIWKYAGRRRAQVGGGGGTDFDPAISYANSKHFDGLVYLTDGYGGRSVRSRWRMLWMLTTDPADFSDGRPWLPREATCHLFLDS